MKRLHLSLFLMITMLVFTWLPVTPAHASAEHMAFTAIDATCSVTPGTQWVSGNLLHVRGEVDIKRMASANPLANGANMVTTNFDINLSNGNGAGWGTFMLQPDGVNGKWAGSFAGSVFAGVFSGHGAANGTGALSNQKLTASFQGIPVPANQPCLGPASDADQIQGSILSLP